MSWRRRPAVDLGAQRVEELLPRLVDDGPRVREADPEAASREMEVDRERLRPAVLAEVVGVDRLRAQRERGDDHEGDQQRPRASRATARSTRVQVEARAAAAPAAAIAESQ